MTTLTRTRTETEPNEIDVLLTKEEVSKYLRISPRKLEYLREEGKIPSTKIGKQVRVRLSDLRTYVKLNTQRMT
jgi:excisionase family DNA binding protein